MHGEYIRISDRLFRIVDVMKDGTTKVISAFFIFISPTLKKSEQSVYSNDFRPPG